MRGILSGEEINGNCIHRDDLLQLGAGEFGFGYNIVLELDMRVND